MDEQTKNNLQEFSRLAEKSANDEEWGVLGKIASKFGFSPAITIRIIYFVWVDLKNRIEAK